MSNFNHPVMKKYLIMNKLAIIVVGFLLLASCDDFLVESPKDQIAVDQFFDSPEDARSTVNAIYRSGVPTFYDAGGFRGNGHLFGGYLSGLFGNQDKGEAVSILLAQDLAFGPQNLNDFLDGLWSGSYLAISRANNAVKYIPLTDRLAETESQQLLAEARFFRAFNYFFLVKYFGDVPLVLEPVENLDNIFVLRDDTEAVYGQIVSDLNWAIQNGGLANVPFVRNGFRITQGAAATLLADVHLQMAGYPLQAQDSYAQAAAAARSVIQSGAYSLIEHGPTLQASAYNVMRTSDLEDEYIYSIEYNADIAPNGAPMWTYPGNIRPPAIKYSRTLNAYYPISQYVGVYDPDLDLRIQNQQFFFNSIEIDGTNIEFGEWATYLWHDDQALFESGRGDKDMSVYRYAEVLLIAAEAIARSEGVTAEAIGYLADVRSRAYWETERSVIVADLVGLSEQQFVEEVWKERLRELPLEVRTWSDIQRTRLYPVTSPASPGEVNFEEVIGHSNNWGQTFQEHHLLLPISQNELDRNPELTQNPGYE
jgi:hypothetical protein